MSMFEPTMAQFDKVFRARDQMTFGKMHSNVKEEK